MAGVWDFLILEMSSQSTHGNILPLNITEIPTITSNELHFIIYLKWPIYIPETSSQHQIFYKYFFLG